MSQTYDANYQIDVTKLAIGMADSLIEGVKTSLGLTPSGASQPSDEELAAFVFHQQRLYPPQLFTYPDGTQIFASPWILALEFAENGKEWLQKFERFTAKAGM